MTEKRQIILSGVQPSGGLMLGNYLGALKNWVQLQKNYDCLFCVVDMHAITIRRDPEVLRSLSYEAAAIYLASGIDPQKNLVFIQSHVPEHAELGWILSCQSYMGELSRMTQFKDKSAKQKNIGVGLFSYPALMAADILLYQANLVPVGQDQKQHLELTRDLAMRMNNAYGELFVVPEVFIPPVGAKIMSLTDPTAKMSKSDPDPNAVVYISDDDSTILKKLKRAVTDSGSEIAYTDEKPGIKNLIAIQSAITGKAAEQIVEGYRGKQYGHLKVETAELVVECIKPIREKYQQLLKDKGELDRMFKRSAEQARARAQVTLRKVQEAIGFVVVR
ncbi:MAG: tryptophan--tRNA ligase [Bdellovibrionota bacterium]